MNRKIIFYSVTLFISIIGLVSSLLDLFNNKYLFQYLGLNRNMAGVVNSLVFFVLSLLMFGEFLYSRKQKK